MTLDPYVPCDVPRQSGGSTQIPSLTEGRPLVAHNTIHKETTVFNNVHGSGAVLSPASKTDTTHIRSLFFVLLVHFFTLFLLLFFFCAHVRPTGDTCLPLFSFFGQARTTVLFRPCGRSRCACSARIAAEKEWMTATPWSALQKQTRHKLMCGRVGKRLHLAFSCGVPGGAGTQTAPAVLGRGGGDGRGTWQSSRRLIADKSRIGTTRSGSVHRNSEVLRKAMRQERSTVNLYH